MEQEREALAVESVSKSFGEVSAVRGVSFGVRRGEIFGIVGPNGAGKTTILRMVMDIFRPDAGQIRLAGAPIEEATKQRIGYLPEERGIYLQMKVAALLEYFGMLKDLSRAQAKANAERWLKRFGLWDARDRRVETLSKGNQQKVQLILALVADPELVILDEPLSGLDPVNARELIDIIRELAREGRTLLFSSHQMPVVESVCDRVLMISRGRAVLCGSPAEILDAHTNGSRPASLEEVYLKVVQEEQ
ncbi:MAG: ATP-binding cassette domain-containing protein [Blastocatellia bacterium]|nr:ATP-binding cassette domain-containing protein [Blastocatellia bacterium]